MQSLQGRNFFCCGSSPVSGKRAFFGKEQGESADQIVQSLPRRDAARFDAEFRGVHGVPQRGKAGCAKSGRRLPFCGEVSRAHIGLLACQKLPQLPGLALQHDEQVEERLFSLGLLRQDSPPDLAALAGENVPEQGEHVEFRHAGQRAQIPKTRRAISAQAV